MGYILAQDEADYRGNVKDGLSNAHFVLTDDEAHEYYDEYLDETGERSCVTVAGLEYQVSEVLKAVDPIAYRVGFSDYEDMMLTDGGWIDTDDLPN